MKREEAKEILTHNWTRVDNPNYSESELDEAFFMAIEALKALPSAELPAEAEFTDLPDIPRYYYEKVVGNMSHEINMLKEQLESAEAEPKWNCTANFVAEQLDRLRKMTDEEKWEFFRKFFGMGDAVQGEWIKDYEKNIYKCSVCGCEEVVPTCMGEPTIWKYCPNCGSAISTRMKGGGEE